MPAWAVIQGSRRYRITPQILSMQRIWEESGGQRPPGWVGHPKAKHTISCPQSRHGIGNPGLWDTWVLSLRYPLQWVPTLEPLWSCGAGREGNPETHPPLPPTFLPSC